MREALGGFRLKNGVCSVKGSLSSTWPLHPLLKTLGILVESRAYYYKLGNRNRHNVQNDPLYITRPCQSDLSINPALPGKYHPDVSHFCPSTYKLPSGFPSSLSWFCIERKETRTGSKNGIFLQHWLGLGLF
jgi:hypothetical protein